MSSQDVPLRPGEQVIKSGVANLQRNLETVGGHLYLTDQRLLFRSHGVNLQRGATEVSLQDIQLVETGWTKFLGFLPLVPNAVAVFSKGNGQHRFTVFGRSAWATAITQAMRAAG